MKVKLILVKKKRIYKGDLEEMAELQSGPADRETWWESSTIGTRELICLGHVSDTRNRVAFIRLKVNDQKVWCLTPLRGVKVPAALFMPEIKST